MTGNMQKRVIPYHPCLHGQHCHAATVTPDEQTCTDSVADTGPVTPVVPYGPGAGQNPTQPTTPTEPTAAAPSFRDVQAGACCADAVAWAHGTRHHLRDGCRPFQPGSGLHLARRW